MTAKNEVLTLVQEAASMAAASGLPLDKLRAIAFCDPSRDARLTSLGSFDKAKQAVASIPNFGARFGTEESARAVLQFVYQYFARADSLRYEEATFEGLWGDFTAEIQEARWISRGLANVRNFTSENPHLDLGDGVVIRGRHLPDLESLGFGHAILGRLSEDWSGFGASSFVLVAEHSVLKQPENIVTIDAGAVWGKAIRAVGALRLADAGSISIGPMWMVRAARFNVGIGGLFRYGVSIPSIGPRYVWSDRVGRAFPRIYRQLAQLERDGYGKSPGNLAIALRAFMATYDRWPLEQDSQLLDSVTALEAVLGTGTEITFKLAFRVAALLADNDNKRAELLRLVKDFYDTRSKLVHGEELREKHRLLLAKVDDLRCLVRRLLRSFVALAASPPGTYDRSFFEEELDVALVDATEREKLRTALALDRE
jgi:hypothetical protein